MKAIALRLGLSAPLVAAVLFACSSDNPITVGAPQSCADAGMCVTDQDCSDNIFCNGIERCMPGGTLADCRGCIRPLTGTCLATQSCNEVDQRCETVCPHSPDADGDGHRSRDCGGDDCDDNDANRFPGNVEICDATHDEDCDPSTYGNTDGDTDGYVAATCCNVRVDGSRNCGLDCDDSNAGIHPGLPEICNGIDDNCNAQIDEGTKVPRYVDADHDGFGVPGVGSQQCPNASGYSAFANDCDDTNAAIFPGSMVCSGAANTDSVNMCDAATGTYIATACNKGTICVPQPNGTGICR